MYVYLSKILPLFVMPVSVVLLLIVLALLMTRTGWLKTAKGLLAAAVVLLWASATPFVAESLYRALEADYPPKPLADIPAGDCIVVLGGVVGPAVWPRVEVELNEGVDRVYKAAQLVRAGRGDMVIVSAGNQPWSASQWTEADLIRDLLVEWGVSKEAVFLEGSSRNTWENAVYSKNLIDSIHCGSVLLVTSAAHGRACDGRRWIRRGEAAARCPGTRHDVRCHTRVDRAEGLPASGLELTGASGILREDSLAGAGRLRRS